MAEERALTGVDKAAILLMTIGKERATVILRNLKEVEVTEIAATIARRQFVLRHEAEAVLQEFNTISTARRYIAAGGADVARGLLESSLGTKRAQEIFEQLAGTFNSAPFEFLRKADPRQLLTFLRDEHPQAIALVLAHLRSEQASLVLSGLSEEMQQDVSVRVATLDRTNPDVLAQVESVMRKRMSGILQPQAAAETPADGVQTLVDILNRSDRATERTIFEGLDIFDAELADQVRSRMFVFEDIVSIDDRSIQLILRQVDAKELAVALKGVRAEVKTKIVKNMSERAGQNLEEEIVLLGPVKLKTVEEAQGSIVRVIRSLEESGQLVLARGGDQFVN